MAAGDSAKLQKVSSSSTIISSCRLWRTQTSPCLPGDALCSFWGQETDGELAPCAITVPPTLSSSTAANVQVTVVCCQHPTSSLCQPPDHVVHNSVHVGMLCMPWQPFFAHKRGWYTQLKDCCCVDCGCVRGSGLIKAVRGARAGVQALGTAAVGAQHGWQP